METPTQAGPPPEAPKSNGCLIAGLIGLVILLIGWGMCSGALGI